jgi:hypothetical protein
VLNELEWWEAHREDVRLDGADLPEDVLRFISEGLWLEGNLEASVHDEGGVDAAFDDRKVASWLRISQRSRRKVRADLAAGPDGRDRR